MIKLFAADLDGTLLNGLHLTDRTILRSIARVRKAGMHFSLATGRTVRDPRQLGFQKNVCVVCANGSMVLGEDGTLLRSRPLDQAFVEELVTRFSTEPLEFITTEHTYHLQSEEAHRAAYSHMALWRRVVTRGMSMTGGPEHVYNCTPAQIAALRVVKINAHIAGMGRADQIHDFLNAHTDVATNAPFDPCMFEITAAGVDKGEAVSWLANHLGIRDDEVAVYGDGGNDIAMLRRFSHAYATHGASDDAKRAAGNVIGSCITHAVPHHVVRTLRTQGSLA